MIMAMGTIMTMTESAELYRLLAWFSPGYPIGAYTYSHGLEQAVEAGAVHDAVTARAWIADLVELGAGFADGVFLAESLRAATEGDDDKLARIAEFAAAFSATAELALETNAQGAAFLKISGSAWPVPALDRLHAVWPGPYAFPIAAGCLCAGHGIGPQAAVTAFLHGFAANLVSAAVRLVPLGQTDGQRITAALESLIGETAGRALTCPYEAASNAAFMTDISSMLHETQHTRLFRS